MILCDRLSREFSGRRVVDEVSFSLGKGECLALFGPNGAGKTTLLRLLGGLLKPTSGKVEPSGIEARSKVGVISHHTMLYDALTARENLEFFARLYGAGGDAVDNALVRMGAGDFAGVRVRELSRGMRQRVAIARAIVHRPEVLLADEPYTGLDVSGASALTALLGDLRDSGTTIIVVTHNAEQVKQLADRVATMDAGHLINA